MSMTLKHYIGGQWISGNEMAESRSPTHLPTIVSQFPTGGTSEISKAVSEAQQAFSSYRKTPAPYRGELVQNLGTLVRNNKQYLAEIITQEIGKPLRESLGSVQEVIDTCTFFASEGRRLYGQTVPSEMPNKKLFTFRKPLGVCGIITAGNFPIAVPAWYLVPALLCGNTIIWKPSEDAPTIAYLFTQLFEKAGFPKGTLNLVMGNAQTGQALVKAAASGHIQKIGFTGASSVGRDISTQVGKALQKPCLELGGKNPMVIMEDAELESATDAALFSAFGTSGQRCTSLGILFLQESIQDKFMKLFLDKVKNLSIGNPTHKNIFYGPMMSERALNRYEQFCETYITSHHTLLSPSKGRITENNSWTNLVDADTKNGLFAHPVVVSGVTPKDDLFMQETFGPMIGTCPFKTIDEAITLANTSGYGLSSAIFTQSPRYAFQFQEDIRAGMLSINNSTSGAEAHLPFGGVGFSGNGSRQSGIWVVDEFTSWQSVNWDYSGSLQLAQIDVPDQEGDVSFVYA
jgi:alpha-ketoglutaric semialdehyde dehydrogenase